MRPFPLLCFCLLSLALSFLPAQQTRKSHLVPSAAGFALGKNEVEVNLFSAFGYSFQAFNFSTPPYRYYEGKFHALSATLQATYGLNASRNVNIGLDLQQQTTLEAGNGSNAASYLQAGPRVRWRPLGPLGDRFELILQNAVLFGFSGPDAPLAPDPQFNNQLIASQFYRLDSLRIDLIFQAIGSFNILPRAASWEAQRRRPFSMPLSLLAGLAPNENILFFASFAFNPEWGNVPWVEAETYFLRRSATALSAGMQLTLQRKHSLFLSHSFLLGTRRGGGANAINLGLRLLFLEMY